MVLRVDVVEAALRARYGEDRWACARAPRDRPHARRPHPRRRGVSELAGGVAHACGCYEGFDERIVEHFCTESLSIGRYVVAGGELAAMVVCDAILRKLPGRSGTRPRVRGVVQRGAGRRRRGAAALRPPGLVARLGRARGAAERPPRPDRRMAGGAVTRARRVAILIRRRRKRSHLRRPLHHEHRHRQPRARAAPPRPGLPGRRPRPRPLPGHRGHAPPDPGVRGRGDQAPGRGRARDLHGPQAVLRRRRRAHVPRALAQDREDRGRGAGRCPAREAVLPARPGRQARRVRERRYTGPEQAVEAGLLHDEAAEAAAAADAEVPGEAIDEQALAEAETTPTSPPATTRRSRSREDAPAPEADEPSDAAK